MDSFSRIVIKQGSGEPTVPVSADHRNGDWIATDIYEGEFYLDTDTGLTYTRNSSGITLSDGSPTMLQAKLNITQTGTNAPVLIEFVNQIGTITPSYSAVGTYILTSTGNFPTGKIFITTNFNTKQGDEIVVGRVNDNELRIYTFSGGVLTDSRLASNNFASILIEKYP
jgi:hypothetical protein